MVDVMGQTPEEFEQMLKDQIAAAEKKAKAIQELVERLTSARVSGMDANRDVEVEELERSIMEAYAQAGRNMAAFVRENVSKDFKDEGGAIEAYAATVEPVLNSLGR